MEKPKTKLEYFRRINFLSQLEVSTYLGMSQPGYRKIETGEVRLNVEIAQKLVKLYKLEKIEDLLEPILEAS